MTTAVQAINTMGEVLGQPLNTAYFVRPGFSLDLSQMPSWAPGKAQPLAAGVTPPLLTDAGFIPRAGYIHAQGGPSVPAYVKPGDPFPAFSWLEDELAPYPNGDAIQESGYSPFSWANGILTVTADRTPERLLPWLPVGYPQLLVSGALCSYPFSQQYGYWEIKAKLPAGPGLWPAFWMVPTDMSWPPEIDVVEVLGGTPKVFYTTVHDAALKATLLTSTQIGYGTLTGIDLSLDYHRYGVEWTATKLCWYLDRKLAFSQPTPPTCHQPFYWIIDLAVGGPTSWGGPPDATTVFPARLHVAEVNVWEIP